ncbi:hypothetical protein ABMA28_003398 [Loxostege sticticalis]|uniref:Uncharacterized protein n=1 Tax=Loxostege sticticalis TaxID=481309 RepID=A0ABD0SW58_LOXSC
MRLNLLLFLLFVAVCWVYGEGEEEGWNGDRDSNRGDRDRDDDHNINYDEESWNSGNKDRDQMKRGDKDPDIYYPCDFEDDIDCVRHFFASSGQCKEVHNYGNKPVYRTRLVTYEPGFNLTIVLNKSRIKYIGDRITRFYINKKTDNLVMAVDFEGINVDTKFSTFFYQRRGQEPIKRTDFTNGTYPVTLTAVIPLKKGINFKESRVTAYFASLPENFEVGPKVLASTDPVVLQVNAAFLANLSQALLESSLAEAPSLYFGYLQKYICDFGIPISS